MQITSSSQGYSLNRAYSSTGSTVSVKNSATDNTGQNQLSAQLDGLKSRDREVKAHEQAHLSAAGGFALSAAKFTYVVGPDGQRYATGGEVKIDVSPVEGDPEATIRKAETIRRAALAPAEPSSQDYAVAAKAAALAAKAAAELAKTASGQAGLGGILDVVA